MIDLFFPPSPQAFRKGRVHRIDSSEPMDRKRPKGRDPAKAKARQARYRARMRADPVRHAKHVQACKDWHDAHREYSRAQARAWKAAHRPQK